MQCLLYHKKEVVCERDSVCVRERERVCVCERERVCVCVSVWCACLGVYHMKFCAR